MPDEETFAFLRSRADFKSRLQQVGELMPRKPQSKPELEGSSDGKSDELDAESDHRSATAKAAEWASRIMTISLEMVLPGLAGYWLDGVLGTKVVFMLIGFAAGALIAFKQLLAIANQNTKRSQKQARAQLVNDTLTNSATENSGKDKL